MRRLSVAEAAPLSVLRSRGLTLQMWLATGQRTPNVSSGSPRAWFSAPYANALMTSSRACVVSSAAGLRSTGDPLGQRPTINASTRAQLRSGLAIAAATCQSRSSNECQLTVPRFWDPN